MTLCLCSRGQMVICILRRGRYGHLTKLRRGRYGRLTELIPTENAAVTLCLCSSGQMVT